MDPRTRGWIVDIIFGGVVGGVAGAIVAVNVVIYSGVDAGYEASIAEVMQEKPLVGILTITILIAGPLLGIVAARRIRRPIATGHQ